MIYLRTGTPGAGKTLNTIREICHDSSVTQKPKFYNNIKAFLLDLDFCNSFQGFFYGLYLPSITGAPKYNKYIKIIKSVHAEHRLVDITDVPWLSPDYAKYTEKSAIDLFVSWCRRCYPKSNLAALNQYLSESDEPTVEGIKYLNYHWTKTDDPTRWYELPNGSVSVFDECQDYFPPLSNAAKRPHYYTQFQKHRHSGVDIHLVTQHYTFLDNVIQKCTNLHVHYFRPMSGAVISRFQRDKQFNTDYRGDLEKCVKSSLKRDSSFYGVYWSADEHTAKFKMPPKLIILMVAFFLLFFIIWYLFSVLLPTPDEPKPEHQKPATENVAQANPTPTKTAMQYQQFSVKHPIQEMCESYEYTGYHVTRSGALIEVEHIFNCVTSETETIQITKSDAEGNEQSSRVDIPKTRTLTSSFLEQLGYRVNLIDNMPTMTYNGQKIYLRQF